MEVPSSRFQQYPCSITYFKSILSIVHTRKLRTDTLWEFTVVKGMVGSAMCVKSTKEETEVGGPGKLRQAHNKEAEVRSCSKGVGLFTVSKLWCLKHERGLASFALTLFRESRCCAGIEESFVVLPPICCSWPARSSWTALNRYRPTSRKSSMGFEKRTPFSPSWITRLPTLVGEGFDKEVTGTLDYHGKIGNAFSRLRSVLNAHASTGAAVLDSYPQKPAGITDVSGNVTGAAHSELASQVLAPHRRPRALRVTLPKLQIPVFSGEIRKWQGFWGHYEATIRTQPDPTDIEKF